MIASIHLTAASPCIDIVPDPPPPPLLPLTDDIDLNDVRPMNGNPMFGNGRQFDMGADEFFGPPLP